MLNEPRHIIEKIQVDIDVGSIEIAEKIKNEINDFIKSEVMPMIEACFAEVEHDIGDSIVRLEKLDLSVNTTSWNIHSNTFKQEIRSEVEKQIAPILENAKVKSRMLREEIMDRSQSFMDENLQIYGKDERILTNFFHFLEKGTLPWWNNALEESRQLFSEDVLLAVIRQNADPVKRELESTAHSDRFYQRLTQQFPISVVSSMLSVRLSGEAIENRVIEAIREIKTLHQEVSKKMLLLLWQLSNEKTKEALFEREVVSPLFTHIHSQFYQKKLDLSTLNDALRTTHSVLRFLFIISNRKQQLVKLETGFVESLHKQTSTEILVRLKETVAYRKLVELNPTLLESLSDQVKIKSEKANGDAQQQESILESAKFQEQELENSVDDVVESRERPLSKGELDKNGGDTNNPTSEDSAIKNPSSENSAKEDSVLEKKTESTLNEIETALNEKNSFEETSSKSEPTSSKQDQTNQNTDEPISASSSDEDGTTENGTKAHLNEIESANSQKASVKENSGRIEVPPIDQHTDPHQHNVTDDNKDLVQKEKQLKDNLPIAEERENKINSGNVDPKNSLEEKQHKSESTNLAEISSEQEMKSVKDEVEKARSTDENTSIKSSKTDTNTVNSEEISTFQKVLNEHTSNENLKLSKVEQILPDYLYVNNAGLVLLNPFLPALFKHLELISESGKLVDPELAACVLHYAATGREGDFEFEMIFEKYLCGLHPSETLNRAITLTELQKEEVNKVLSSALTYWEVMKNKPIALLQNEFLMRPGKLITEKTNHRLVIERKTFDLLLDKLPWSYSMIKFSWKKELIFVEW